MAGEKKIKPRRLTAKEEQRAHSLMDAYDWLPGDVVRQHMRKHKLWSDFDFGDLLGVARLALCETAVAYVKLGYELPEEEERFYIARSLINALKKYVHKEKQMRTARQEGTVIDGIISLERIKEREHPFSEIEVNEVMPLPLEAFRSFARTLPADERAAFEEKIQDIEDERDRTLDEMATALGISRSHLYKIRCSIGEKLLAWIAEEWAA